MYTESAVLRVTHKHIGSSGEERVDVERGPVAERPRGTVGYGRGGASLRIRKRLQGDAGAGAAGTGAGADGPASDVLGSDAAFVIGASDIFFRPLSVAFA